MSDDAEDGYKVGYKRPPRHTRFEKGVSGNSSGRRKGARSLRAEVQAELAKKVTVTESGRRVTLTKRQLAVKAMVNKAINADARAFELMTRLEANPDEGAPDTGPSTEDLALLREHLARNPE